jgi:hypothetical protein
MYVIFGSYCRVSLLWWGQGEWDDLEMWDARKRWEMRKCYLGDNRTEANLCDVLKWIHLAQIGAQRPALVDTAMNLRIPHKVRDLFSSWATISFSRSTLLTGAS